MYWETLQTQSIDHGGMLRWLEALMKRQDIGTKGKTSGQKAKHWNSGTDENIKHYLQTLPPPHTHTHTRAHTLQPAHTQARGIFPDHMGGCEPFLLMLPSMDCRLLKKSHSPTSSWATDQSQHLEAVCGASASPISQHTHRFSQCSNPGIPARGEPSMWYTSRAA